MGFNCEGCDQGFLQTVTDHTYGVIGDVEGSVATVCVQETLAVVETWTEGFSEEGGCYKNEHSISIKGRPWHCTR